MVGLVVRVGVGLAGLDRLGLRGLFWPRLSWPVKGGAGCRRCGPSFSVCFDVVDKWITGLISNAVSEHTLPKYL